MQQSMLLLLQVLKRLKITGIAFITGMRYQRYIDSWSK